MKVGNKVRYSNMYKGARYDLIISDLKLNTTAPYSLTREGICDIIFHSIRQQHGETFNRRLERNTVAT
jgi:hypothetical protein